MSEILTIQGLSKRYGKSVALDKVDLTLPSGKIVGLLGPNGSGKTTMIKIIAGLLTPNGGTVLVDGKPVGVESKKIVAYLPDKEHLYSYMTVKQTVKLYKDFFEDFREELAYEMLEHLNIKPSAKLKTLSKGNREKVSLALTMSRNARLYVLDEPIAGVDPAARDYVIQTIINNYNHDATVLISTHLISDVEQVLDEAVFIKDGKIILHDSVDNIREENGKSVDELFREVFKW